LDRELGDEENVVSVDVENRHAVPHALREFLGRGR
jgi:hypothetical protein